LVFRLKRKSGAQAVASVFHAAQQAEIAQIEALLASLGG
jgi:hypothetical protein